MGDFMIRKGKLNKYKGTAENVAIPDDVTVIGYRAFKECTALKSVVIPSGVTAIEDSAFECCKYLESVSIPDSVTKVGDYAFNKCRSLKKLSIPESVTSIGRFAFADIPLSKVTLPKTVFKIGAGAFAGTKEIHVFDTIDPDADPAAEKYSFSKRGWFNSDVGLMGNYMDLFYDSCPTFPRSTWKQHRIVVHSAETNTVKYVVGMPGAINREVNCAFASSWGRNAEFCFTHVDQFFKEMDAETRFAYAVNRIKYPVSLSESTRELMCGYLKRNARKTVFALIDQNDLEAFLLLNPDDFIKASTIKEFLEYATTKRKTRFAAWFQDHINSSPSMKNELQQVADNPYLAKNLKSEWSWSKLPDGTMQIDKYKGKAEEIVVPPFVDKVPVTRVSSHLTAEKTSKFGNASIKTVILPEHLLHISDEAFYCCESLVRVNIPDGVMTIGSDAFRGCESLRSITIPEGVISVGDYAFAECKNLQSIDISASVSDIGNNAFFDCQRIKKVSVSDKNKVYRSENNCIIRGNELVCGFKSSVIPEGITQIGENAFSCVEIGKIIIPNSVEEIGESAFEDCDQLKSIIIPDSVTEIGDNAFDGCWNLSKVIVSPNSYAEQYCKDNGINYSYSK